MSPHRLSRSSVGLAVALTCLVWPTSTAFAQSGTRTNKQPRTNQPSNSKPNRNAGVAVVELFTSQGCSSCPSADETLRQIASLSEKGELPVYVLSFHVDYWNRLGWNDPYSDALYSNRQRGYASAIGSTRIYTPQMIVSGTIEFVGSDKPKAHAAISKSLGQQTLSTVTLKVVKNSTEGGVKVGSITVQYDIAGVTEGMVLNVALVQTPKPNMVPRGENAGRELAHVNVVRAFESIRISQTAGTIELKVSEDVDASTAKVIGFVQNPRSLAVNGAGYVTL